MTERNPAILLVGPTGEPVPGSLLAALQPGMLLVAKVEVATAPAQREGPRVLIFQALRWTAPGQPLAEAMLTGAADAVNGLPAEGGE